MANNSLEWPKNIWNGLKHLVTENNKNRQYIDENLHISISKKYNIAENFDNLAHFGEEN